VNHFFVLDNNVMREIDASAAKHLKKRFNQDTDHDYVPAKSKPF